MVEFPGLEQLISSHIDTQPNTQLDTQLDKQTNTQLDTQTDIDIHAEIDTEIDAEIDGIIHAQIDSHITAQPVESLPPETHQRFLRISLGSQDSVLVPLEQITEIVKVNPVDILPVPQMPDWVLGICNWRGEMLWLIDFNPVVGYSSQFQSDTSSSTQSHINSGFSTGASLSSSLPSLLMVLVVQIHYQSIGIVVPQINDIEFHPLQQLQPPIPGLFPPNLLPIVLGVLPECCDPVVNIQAIELSPIWKKHQGGSGDFSS